MWKFFGNTSVKAKIILVVVIATLAATSAVVYIRIDQLTEQADRQLLERLQDNTYTTVAIFDTVRLQTMGMLDTIASFPMVTRSFSEGTNEDLEDFLYVFLDSMSQTEDGVSTFANIILYDSEFMPFLSALPDGEVPTMLQFPSNFLTAQMGQTMVSSAVQSPQTGLVQFLFTAPVMIDGRFEGVAAILANTQMLEVFLRDGTRRYGSFVNIADRDGNIFFSNRADYVGRHAGELGVVDAFGYMPLGRLFHQTSAITGVDKIAYISIDIPLGWTIVSFFDAHSVDDVVMLIITSLIPSLSGIFVAAAFILFIVHRSLKPLGVLASSANEVSKGNTDVTFHADRNEEIGQVAQAFSEAVEHMKLSRKHAEDASKAKSDFLSKMSHEIRTPMNAIIGMAELILRENLSATAREQATTIKHSGGHLLSIINDILDLSKVESGKLELAKVDYLFHSTIQDVISIIKMRMSNPDVRFAAYMQADIPNNLYGDEVRVRQILLNILTNALKYTKSGHFSLNVTGKKKNEDIYILTIKIRDTGLGIKSEDIEMLFDQFSQFDVEKNRNVEGTGLGLSITKSLVKLMDGNIEVNSVYGKGSEFVITIPQKYTESKQETPCFDDKRALLFCRTSMCEEYISRAFDDLAVTYAIASDESELSKSLAQAEWDFVFAEADMAYAAQKAAKENSRTAKIVMLTDSYEAFYEARDNQDFALLVMPAYFISIANVLSGRDADYLADSQNIEQFVAPSANILLVDDIETNLKVGKGLLSLYEMNIDTCLSGKESIEAVLAKDYDLVLMDHMMPGMDGVEAVKIIRSLGGKHANLPIVALTANAIIGAKEMFLKNGFNDFISKPIEVSKLNSVLAKWIPSEKQMKAEHPQAVESEPETEITITGVDVKRGMALSGGGAKNYLDTLSVFHKNGLTKAGELTECLQKENWSLYTTYVHALKSASANIGANKISEEASALESAGISNNIDFIKNHTGGFLANLQKLLESINEAVAANAQKPDSEPADENLMKELLAALKSAVEAFDSDAMDNASEKLQDFTHIPEKGASLSELLQNVFLGQYKLALEQIDELMERTG